MLSLTLLIACGMPELKVGEDTAAATDDTAAASDDTGSVDDTGDAPAEPEADYSQYTAELTFSYDTWGDSYDCAGDETSETAEAVTDEDTLEALQGACPACTHFWESTPERTEICDWIDLPESDWRGAQLGDGFAQLYRFDQDDDGNFAEDLLDNNASFDGFELSFQSSFNYWVEVQVEGTISFPEVEQ